MKHFRKTIALFLVVVMLTTTMGSTVLAGTENQGFSDQAETTVDSRFLDGIDTDGYDYVITSQEQADELRVSDDSKSILVACGSVYLSASQQEPSQSAIQQRSSYLMLLRKHWTSARVLRSASLV